MRLITLLIIFFYSSVLVAQNNIEIEIHSQSFLNLLRLQNLSIENKTLKKEFKAKIPIIITDSNSSKKAKLGLDGLGEEHWSHADIFKSTFDIKISNNKFHETFQDFRLLDKKSINYESTIFFNYILKYFKQPIRKYSLVNVRWKTLNSTTGYYEKVLEESFSNKILDSNGLREGFLFKYDIINDIFLNNTYKIKNGLILHNTYLKNNSDYFENSKIKIIEKNNSTLKKQYKFLQVNKDNIEIEFELDQIALLFAIHFVWGDMHSFQTHNAKFYFNPINKKTMVLPTDFWESKKINIENKNFIFQYDYQFSWLKNLVVKKDFQLKVNYHLNNIINDTNFSKHISLFKNKKLANIVLDNLKNLKKNNVQLFFDQDFTTNKVDYYSIWPFITKKIYFRDNLEDKLNNNSNLDTKKFIVDKKNKIIKFKNKNILIDNPISISENFKNYKLVISPNSNINFVKNGKLVIHSNVLFNGTEDQKIQVRSNTENAIIIFFGKENLIKYSNFSDFNINDRLDNFFLTSPLTFYNTDIKIYNTTFDNFKSEDQINIINSQFEIINSNFFNAKSDAVDIDSGNGKIKNINFKNCGNDCLDFSHTIAEVINFKSYNSGDKAISVGEKSSIHFNNINISTCKTICIAIKDESDVHMDSISIKNSIYGIVAFNKKGNYKAPKLFIKNIYIDNMKNNISEESSNSIIIYNNKDFKINKINKDVVQSFY